MTIDPSAAAVVGIVVSVTLTMHATVCVRAALLGWAEAREAATWDEYGLPWVTYRLGRRLRLRRERALLP